MSLASLFPRRARRGGNASFFECACSLRRHVAIALVAALACAGVPTLATAQDTPAVLLVQVTDRETGRPLPQAVVRVRPIERAELTNDAGQARFGSVPSRSLTVAVSLLGYAPSEMQVRPEPTGETRVEVALMPTPLQLASVVVTATGRERSISEVYRPTTILDGTELQRALSSSVPATLDGVPGFRSVYNGPGASSPSIRGLAGDRVLMLEDGNRTGDLYQTASDHGVMVEPLTATRIEVVRGPAGLLYGANALGGVVNVIRDDIPRTRPDGVTGTMSTQFESVNAGRAVAGVVSAPIGAFALRTEVSGRLLDDTRTPAGVLDRTSMRVGGGAVGGSWIAPGTGFLGGAVRLYDSRYGVPGEFNGVLIPGGHPNGVEIETQRISTRARAGWYQPVLGFFDAVEADAAVIRYSHDEIEGQINGQTVLGARFDQITSEGNVIARHHHALHDHLDNPLRAEGAFGATFRQRSLTAFGVSPGSRSGNEVTAAAFAYEEFARGPLRLQAGLRYDAVQVTPRRLDSIRVRTREREVTKGVSARDFGGVSGSVALLRTLASGWTIGANVARSFRAPSLEELYSDGPHLADFSFDIGSPDLGAEIGTGLDVFLRGSTQTVDLEFATYVNRVDNFLYYGQTGETVRVLRDGAEPRITPVYEARGDNALFVGGEGRVQWQLARGLVLDATASYVRATRRGDDDPLPFIPPVNGRAEVRYEHAQGTRGTWFTALGVDGAAAQNRVPRPVQIGQSIENPQEPTASYGLVTAGAGWRTVRARRAHSLTLSIRNLTNREWRDHLSRVKDIAPQPGRNVQATYRVQF